MYDELSKRIYDKLVNTDMENEEEARKLIKCELTKYLDCITVGIEELQNIISCVSRIKYKGKIIDISNYYSNGEKIYIEDSNNNEYVIYNECDIYVIIDYPKYIHIIDTVDI